MSLLKVAVALAPDAKDWKTQKVLWREEKKDGYQVTIAKEKDASIKAVGKKEWIDLWPKLQAHEEIRRRVEAMPRGTVVMGEMIVPGGFATDVPTALNGQLPLEIFPFAMPFMDGKNRMREFIGSIRFDLEVMGWSLPTINEDLPHPEIMLTQAIGLGWEGWVLKRAHFEGWYKLKPTKEVDAVVMSWKEGVGQYDGHVGSLLVGLYDAQGVLQELADVGSGWTPDARRALVGDACIGKVMEVRYDKLGAGGRLVFPRFVRWRDDKPAENCKVEDIS